MNDATYHQGEATHPVCGGTDIYFPVETRPAEVDGREVPGYLAVLRSDTGQVFGFHRADYRLVRNAELFPQFDEALLECGFDLSGMMVSDAIAYGGARTIRTYRLPRERVEVGVGDPVEFELRILNSYDSSVAFSALSAARRLACLNGMTIGSSFKLYGRHTKGFGVTDLVGKLKAALTLYRQGTEQFMRWGYRRIMDEDVTAVMREIPHMNETLLKKLLGYWAREQQRQGNSLWALYNAATYWATHEGVRRSSSDNIAAIVLEREARVARMVESAAFQRLAA